MAGAKKTVWDISLEIAGKDTGASAALKQVQRSMQDVQKAGKQLSSDFKNFTANIGKLAVGVGGGVAAATAGVVSMANSFAEAGDKAAKTSAALGIGVEAYQELSYAMGQSGVSTQEFDKALQKFNLTVRQGAAGNVAAKKQLDDIGLSAQKLAGMKPEQAMARLSDYMNTLPSDAERTRVAVTLFGKAAGAKMMAAMKQGSAGLRQLSQEARDLGIVISEEQAYQSEAYGDAMDRLKQSVTGMKNQFIGGAIGPLTEAFDHLKNAMVEQMPVIRDLGRNLGQWLGKAIQQLPVIIAKIKEFGTWVKDTATRIADFAGGWKNAAKILAGLAIAPTLISGLKTVFSLGQLVKVGIGAIGPIISGLAGGAGALAGGFGAIAAAALPIIGIIAGIAAVIYTVVRNFDNLKQYALDCIERIKSSFSGAAGGMVVDWQVVGKIAKSILGAIMGILESGVLYAIKTVMNTITSGIQIVIGAFKVLWGIVQTPFAIIETGVKVISALFRGDLSGAIKAIGDLFIRFGQIGQGMFDGLKGIVSGFTGFFKGQFENGLEIVKRLFTSFGVNIGGVFDGIKSSVTGAVAWFKNGFSNAVENIKGFAGSLSDVFRNVLDRIKGAFQTQLGKLGELFSSVFDGIRSTISGAVNFIKDVVNGLPEPFRNVFDGIKIIIDGFVGFWKNVFGAGINAIKNIVGILPNIFSDPIGTVKAIIGEVATFFKTVFQSNIDAVKGIIDGLADRFGGVFTSIKEETTAFVNFFKEKIDAVKNFFGGIGDKVGSLFGREKSLKIPGHAEGGIFTHRHIAEIAENGAEAVVPLNSSPQGFDIWKQAGKIGGYLNRAISQQKVTEPASAQGTPPVMQAAAQRISGGENVINVTFTQNNSFNGGTPDGGVVNQIVAAGQQAADDFEARVKMALDNILRNQRRVSFA